MGTLSERKEVAYRCLLDAALSLSSALEVNELVGRILAASRDVMQCLACSICLPDPATGDLLIRGTQPELKGRVLRVPAGKGIVGRVFRTGQRENTVNAQSEAVHYAGIGLETKTPAHALLTIPVQDPGGCHGVMQALNPVGREFFDDFDEEVFQAFGALIAATLTRMQAQETARRKDLDDAYREAELSVARRAQISFMPPLSFVGDAFEVRVFQKQAADVGGDFFTYYGLADGSFLIAVGDASGKGIPAALESARVCTLLSLKAALCSFERFSEWIGEVNQTLWESAEKAGSLTTLAILVIDRQRRWLQACTFGQPRPRYLSLSNQWEELSCEVYPPLGVLRAERFATRTVPFIIGRQWLLLTDGFIEARNHSGEGFGGPVLAKTLGGTVGTPDPLSVLETTWREFTQGRPQQDDATAFLLTSTRDAPSPVLAFDLVPERMADGRSFFERWAELAGFSEHAAYSIVLGADEVLTNVYRHAYGGRAGHVRCEATIGERALTFAISHSGLGLSQENYLARLAPSVPDGERAGGYGLGFIRQVFDQVAFVDHGHHATVTLTRLLPSSD
ncbi:MAG TPA: SpoIIE family protein phosphatase [Chthoniobacterales bacterium]